MSRIVDKRVLATTAFWLIGLGSIDAALAAPGRFHAELQFIGRPLDLSPPAHAIESLQKTPTPSSSAFPSPLHHPAPILQTPLQLPSLGAEGPRPRGRVEHFVQQFHKEGLPVARLFDNKSTLVHVGLSPRGKPGLWFVHTLH
jgi:hypothetical protein